MYGITDHTFGRQLMMSGWFKLLHTDITTSPKRNYPSLEGLLKYSLAALGRAKQPDARAETDVEKQAGSFAPLGVFGAMTLPKLELPDKATPMPGQQE